MKVPFLRSPVYAVLFAAVTALLWAGPASAQLIDATHAPNPANEGIKKSLTEQIGAGRGDVNTPDSSLFIIKRDPFRAVRRGRQLFQRKFGIQQGFGPLTGDGTGSLADGISIGAGLVDSCAGCHGRPRGSAGAGGNVVTRPDSRDAPHLFGLGLVEMLADEMTSELRAAEAFAITEAQMSGHDVTVQLTAKGIDFGSITAHPDGSVDTSQLDGVDPDLRVKPFFAQGGAFSIRQFTVGAFDDEMGLEAVDPDLTAAAAGQQVVTPAGMVLDGSLDALSSPAAGADPNADPDADGVSNELDTALIDFVEFYLLNYFKAGTDRQTQDVQKGRELFQAIGCTECHVPTLTVDSDRRVADVETVYDPVNGIFNRLFATAAGRFVQVEDDPNLPTLKLPAGDSFVVENFFSDLKRHDLGPNFWEINYDGTIQKEFVTEPLWGVGSTAPYGHDGRSINLRNVILRHGGEAGHAATQFANLNRHRQAELLEFLSSLVLFPPDDTASNLNPGDPSDPLFPQRGHGSINLGALFNDPSDPE